MAIAQNPQNRAVQEPSALVVWAFLGAIFLAVQFASLFTPPLLDDVDASHARKIDDDASIASAESGNAVPATTNREV